MLRDTMLRATIVIGSITLIYTLAVAFCTYMLWRNDRVFKVRQRWLMLSRIASRKAIERGDSWERYHAWFDRISYNKMLYSIFKSPSSFLDEKKEFELSDEEMQPHTEPKEEHDEEQGADREAGEVRHESDEEDVRRGEGEEDHPLG